MIKMMIIQVMIIVLIMRYKVIKKHDSKKMENVKNKQNC